MVETILVEYFEERGQKNNKTAKRNVALAYNGWVYE